MWVIVMLAYRLLDDRLRAVLICCQLRFLGSESSTFAG